MITQEYDPKGNRIHWKDDQDGYESWTMHDANGNKIHIKDNDGYESWRKYDDNDNLRPGWKFAQCNQCL